MLKARIKTNHSGREAISDRVHFLINEICLAKAYTKNIKEIKKSNLNMYIIILERKAYFEYLAQRYFS